MINISSIYITEFQYLVLDITCENPRILFFGNSLAEKDITREGRANENDTNISYQSDKEFIFVSTTLKDSFISSLLHQCINYVRKKLMKPLKRFRKTKSVLLKEYEKMKAQWQVIYAKYIKN